MAEAEGTAASTEEIDRLADGVEISEQELAQRKKFLEFAEEDIKRLSGIGDLARRYADAVIDDFYEHLLGFEDSRATVLTAPFFGKDNFRKARCSGVEQFGISAAHEVAHGLD